MSKFTLLTVIVVDFIKHIRIEIHPLLESESFAEHSRSNILCNQGSFDRNSTRTTHRVNQVTIPTPSRHQNHTGSQHLVQRSFYRFLAITTAVQRLARRIQRQRTGSLCNVNVQQYVRIIDTDRRTFSGFLAEIVHNRIFHFIRNELRMAELIAEHHCVDSESLVNIEIIFPSNGLYLVINFVSILRCEVLDRFQDADSGTKAEISLIHHTFISGE